MQCRVLGWIGLGIGLTLGLTGGWGMDAAGAWQLGQQVEVDQQATQLVQVAEYQAPVQMIRETSELETRTILINPDRRVFAIQIESQAETAPKPEAYLGDYQEFAAETVSVIPLRSRVVRYTHPDGRAAEWRVSGMSGRFAVQAISFDLAPPQQGVDLAPEHGQELQ